MYKSIVASLKRSLLPKDRRFRRIVFGPAAGRWMNLDLTNELRMYLGVFERELWHAYRKLLRPGMRSFDVGGRDGYSALVIASCTGSDVVSFECDPTAIPGMTQVFEKNALPIKAHQAFLGAPRSAGTTLTLDEAAELFFVPDFVKIDVEGAEPHVLAGAS